MKHRGWVGFVAALFLVAGAACGDSTGSNGTGSGGNDNGGGASGDGGSGTGVQADAGDPSFAAPQDGASDVLWLPVDGALECTVPQAIMGYAGDGVACKLGLVWSCSDGKTYRIGGYCAPTGSNNSPLGLHVMCFLNEQDVHDVNTPDPTACSCKSYAATLRETAKECGFPLPGSPQ